MDKLSEIDVITLAKIKNSDKSLANDTRQVRVREHSDFVYTLALIIRLCNEILVYIFEIWDCDVFLEFFIVENCIINKFNDISLLLHFDSNGL